MLMAAFGILVNGERREVDGSISLSALLQRLSLPERRVAVELNGRVVRRSDWPQTVIVNGDKIEVVHFVGGG